MDPVLCLKIAAGIVKGILGFNDLYNMATGNVLTLKTVDKKFANMRSAELHGAVMELSGAFQYIDSASGTANSTNNRNSNLLQNKRASLSMLRPDAVPLLFDNNNDFISTTEDTRFRVLFENENAKQRINHARQKSQECFGDKNLPLVERLIAFRIYVFCTYLEFGTNPQKFLNALEVCFTALLTCEQIETAVKSGHGNDKPDKNFEPVVVLYRDLIITVQRLLATNNVPNNRLHQLNQTLLTPPTYPASGVHVWPKSSITNANLALYTYWGRDIAILSEHHVAVVSWYMASIHIRDMWTNEVLQKFDGKFTQVVYDWTQNEVLALPFTGVRKPYPDKILIFAQKLESPFFTTEGSAHGLFSENGYHLLPDKNIQKASMCVAKRSGRIILHGKISTEIRRLWLMQTNELKGKWLEIRAETYKIPSPTFIIADEDATRGVLRICMGTRQKGINMPRLLSFLCSTSGQITESKYIELRGHCAVDGVIGTDDRVYIITDKHRLLVLDTSWTNIEENMEMNSSFGRIDSNHGVLALCNAR